MTAKNADIRVVAIVRAGGFIDIYNMNVGLTNDFSKNCCLDSFGKTRSFLMFGIDSDNKPSGYTNEIKDSKKSLWSEVSMSESARTNHCAVRLVW